MGSGCSLLSLPSDTLGSSQCCCADAQWDDDLVLKHLTSFGRLQPDDEGLSGEDILVPRLGVRVLVGLFHQYLILPAAESTG